MIGGLPIAQPYSPAPVYAPQPAPSPPAPLPQSRERGAAQPRAVSPTQQAAAPRPARPATPPVVRGQSPDEAPARPTSFKLEMPSPEALGVPVPATPLDWTDLRVRLDRLGATRFALEQLP